MPVKMPFEFRLVIFYLKYILAQEDNCNFENNYQIKTRKSVQNPLKTTKLHTERGKRSIFNIACNLFGELAWDL